MTSSAAIARAAGAIALLLAAVPLISGCGGSSTASTQAPKTSDGRPAKLGVGNTSLGHVLVDAHGHTLYLFRRDQGPTSACTGACVKDWPPLHPVAKPGLGSGTNASLVGTTMQGSGTPQVTYNGHPLYLFKGDHQPGDTNGQGLNAYGGLWAAVSPSGSQISGQASNSGGYGY